MRKALPGARVEMSLFDVSAPEALKLGTMDVAIGLHRQKMPQDLLQQTLLSVEYVCICSQDHPRVGERIDMEDYLREAHVAVGYPGRTDNVYVTTLNDVGPTPRIAARVPSFRGAASLVEVTDMLAVVPRPLIDSIAAPRRIRQVAMPFSIPSTAMNQYWHARYHRDPASIWLRHAIMDLSSKPLRY
jgi:DNA-binding transcriptional LysR family regulator